MKSAKKIGQKFREIVCSLTCLHVQPPPRFAEFSLWTRSLLGSLACSSVCLRSVVALAGKVIGPMTVRGSGQQLSACPGVATAKPLPPATGEWTCHLDPFGGPRA